MKDGEIKKEYCKYVFDENEKKEIAGDMARQIADKFRVEAEKKAVVSDFKSQIEALESSIGNAATKLNNGYEMRNIDCKVVADYDAKLWKFYRLDTGELVRQRKMTADDLQRTLEI